jgi:hypothetical protein
MPSGSEQLLSGENYGFAIDFTDNSYAITFLQSGAEELISGEDYGFAVDFTDNSSAINLPLNVDGVESFGQVGTVSVKEGAGVYVGGTEGLGLVGNSFLIFIWTQVNTNQNPNWTRIVV